MKKRLDCVALTGIINNWRENTQYAIVIAYLIPKFLMNVPMVLGKIKAPVDEIYEPSF